MATSSSQKHAEVKRLSKAIKDNIYDMLRLVDEILSDHEYVDKFGGEGPLIEQMETEEFSHFGGSPGLSALLRAYRQNPKKETWREYRFNVWAMIELSTPAKDRADTQYTNWKAMAKELQAQLEQAEAVIVDLRHSNAELRSKCDTLIAEAAESRGKISALESFARRVA